MSTRSEPAPAPDEPVGHVCAHCDATHEHEHVDEHAVVLTRLGSLARFAWVRVGVGVLALAGLLVLTPPTTALAYAGAGLLGWALTTLLGLLVASVRAARTGNRREGAFVTTAVLAGAAVTPVAAFGVALASRSGLVGGSGEPVAIGAATVVAAAAGLGWYLGAAGSEVVGTVSLRRLLLQESRAGEAARDVAVRTRQAVHPVRDLVWTVVSALVFGLWVFACQFLLVLVVVLIPLHVVLAVSARRLRD
ncbi:hypothetical protein EXU48_03640 [Occultella glacieicola]|uniref:Zinc ribbon domain-containing protein n=1 Tax=Occultella glacieicola TaxID=2518684 RepID=A0ABY2E7A3_9MICO|nr:hypothetical protein [Occultella glacieicola]TDE97308.1 hypothetical protein EXU48_03640 [Occultella glacieicola]